MEGDYSTAWFGDEGKSSTNWLNLSPSLNGDDEVYSVVHVAAGESTLAGYTKSFGAGGSDMWLVKKYQRPATFHGANNTPYGNISTFNTYMNWVQWSQTYGGSQDDGAKCLIQAIDGGYVLSGYTYSYGAGGSDMYLVKTDSSGNLLWTVTFGGLQDDGANCIVQASDEGFVLAGYTNSDVSSQSTWVIKIDSSGTIEWSVICPGKNATSLVRTLEGGYALAVEYPYAFGLVKLDSSGQLLWNQTYPGLEDDAKAESLVQTSDGGYALAGWTLTNSTSLYSGWLMKIDSSGNLEWDRTYPGIGLYSVIQTRDGGYATAGDHSYLIITDSSGNTLWNKYYDGLSEDHRETIFTRVYCVLQISSNQFLMGEVQDSYGYYDRGLGSELISITF